MRSIFISINSYFKSVKESTNKESLENQIDIL